MIQEKFLFTRIEEEEDDFLIDLAESGWSEKLSSSTDEYLDEMEYMSHHARELAMPVYFH